MLDASLLCSTFSAAVVCWWGQVNGRWDASQSVFRIAVISSSLVLLLHSVWLSFLLLCIIICAQESGGEVYIFTTASLFFWPLMTESCSWFWDPQVSVSVLNKWVLNPSQIVSIVVSNTILDHCHKLSNHLYRADMSSMLFKPPSVGHLKIIDVQVVILTNLALDGWRWSLCAEYWLLSEELHWDVSSGTVLWKQLRCWSRAHRLKMMI